MSRRLVPAVQAFGASDYSRAIPLLKRVTGTAGRTHLHVKAGQLLQMLEQQAADRLAWARQFMEQGQDAAAIDQLAELVRTYPGTKAASEAERLLAGRVP